jgi:hypothetical protein
MEGEFIPVGKPDCEIVLNDEQITSNQAFLKLKEGINNIEIINP